MIIIMIIIIAIIMIIIEEATEGSTWPPEVSSDMGEQDGGRGTMNQGSRFIALHKYIYHHHLKKIIIIALHKLYVIINFLFFWRKNLGTVTLLQYIYWGHGVTCTKLTHAIHFPC